MCVNAVLLLNQNCSILTPALHKWSSMWNIILPTLLFLIKKETTHLCLFCTTERQKEKQVAMLSDHLLYKQRLRRMQKLVRNKPERTLFILSETKHKPLHAQRLLDEQDPHGLLTQTASCYPSLSHFSCTYHLK